MRHTIDYYFAPQSPYTYLGHARFQRIASEAGASINVLPMDLGGKVFPVSGGLPLAKRAPQRQAYRLVELRRFSEWLGLPLNLQPKFFPVPGDQASQLIIAVDQKDGSDASLALTEGVLRAVWAQDRNIDDEATLAALLAEQNLPRARLEESHSQAVHERYETNTQRAIDAGIFGSPSYVVDGEMFWGQDRLDFCAAPAGSPLRLSPAPVLSACSDPKPPAVPLALGLSCAGASAPAASALRRPPVQA